jgi:hypothetical protein
MTNVTVVKQRRVLVGIAWISPHELPRYRLYKIYQIEDGGYQVERVPANEPVEVDGRTMGREAAAWQWLKTSCPWPWVGVWYNGHPGLVWGRAEPPPPGVKGIHLKVDWQMVEDAFAIAGRGRGAWGDLPSPEIVGNEAVAYTPFLPGEHRQRAHHDVDTRHPHIVPTRTRREYARLRRRYAVPDGWALDYLPESVIKERWGYRKSYAEMRTEADRRARDALKEPAGAYAD